jgi:hypothetical protein
LTALHTVNALQTVSVLQMLTARSLAWAGDPAVLVGTLVAVDAKAMFVSVLQLVLLPVLFGAVANQARAGGGGGLGGAR